MKKVLLSILGVIFLLANSVNAEEVKKYENMTEEQLIAEFMKSDKESKEIKAKTVRVDKDLENVKKMRKTVNEIKKQLEVE